MAYSLYAMIFLAAIATLVTFGGSEPARLTSATSQNELKAEAVAYAMALEHSAAVKFAFDNPGFMGEIERNQILPYLSQVTNPAFGIVSEVTYRGYAATYHLNMLPAKYTAHQVRALRRISDMPTAGIYFMAGVATPLGVQSPTDDYPAREGAVIIFTKVR